MGKTIIKWLLKHIKQVNGEPLGGIHSAESYSEADIAFQIFTQRVVELARKVYVENCGVIDCPMEALICATQFEIDAVDYIEESLRSFYEVTGKEQEKRGQLVAFKPSNGESHES